MQKDEATIRAGQELKDNAANFWEEAGWHLAVNDDTGLVLFTLIVTAIEAPTIFRPLDRG